MAAASNARLDQQATCTIHVDPPPNVDWERWTTNMKNAYKEKTGRVVSLRLRERRSNIKQLSYFGPMRLLQRTLDDVAALIKNSPAVKEEIEEEVETQHDNKPKGKGGKSKSAIKSCGKGRTAQTTGGAKCKPPPPPPTSLKPLGSQP